MRNYGYPLRRVPYEDWRTKILALTGGQDKNRLSSFIVSFFNADGSTTKSKRAGEKTLTDSIGGMDQVVSAMGACYSTQVQMDCTNALQCLASTDIACPPIDGRLLNTYFSYLISVGYVVLR
jgi:hypothetical protein